MPLGDELLIVPKVIHGVATEPRTPWSSAGGLLRLCSSQQGEGESFPSHIVQLKPHNGTGTFSSLPFFAQLFSPLEIIFSVKLWTRMSSKNSYVEGLVLNAAKLRGGAFGK